MKTILALVACVALQAQSWDVLRGLQPGARIKVVDSAHQEYKGAFTVFSERGVSVATRQGAVEIERARVRRVQVRASSRRARNVVIGAAIGLGLGVAIDQSLGAYFRNETGENAGARAVTYIAPVGLFAGIGAALSPYRTIYRAR